MFMIFHLANMQEKRANERNDGQERIYAALLKFMKCHRP